MAKIVGVKFRNSVKVYYFDPKDFNYNMGDGVIVETARGTEYGEVTILPSEVDDKEVVAPLKPVLRIATEADKKNVEKRLERVPEAIKIAEEKIKKYKLNMKLIDCEFTFDGTKVVFYFSAPGRVDFRELVRELASTFKLRIELRQVGIRDETKIIGGLGPCGRECCCCSCIPEVKKVTIKMAKVQGLSLNPIKISGLCGRLMCCLEYENEHYSETYKMMPKLGSEVDTPSGKGTVVSNNMLKMLVKVKIIDKKDNAVLYKDFKLNEVKFKRCHNAPDDDDNVSVDDDIKNLLD